jgi:hypothetical protein
MSTKAVAVRPLERSLLKSLKKIAAMLAEEEARAAEAAAATVRKAGRQRRERSTRVHA